MGRKERDLVRLDPKEKRHFRVPIYPALVFIAGCLMLAGILFHSYTVYREHMQKVTELNAISYAERLENDLGRGDRIPNRDALSALLQLERSLHGDDAMIPSVTADLSSLFILKEIDLPGFISGLRIDFRDDPVRCELNALHVVGHQIFSHL